MATKKDYIQLINKLTELTQSDTIKWDRRPCPETLIDTNHKIGVVYKTEYKNQYLRLYEEKYKHYQTIPISLYESEYYWDDNVILEFIDEKGEHIWQFPYMRSIWDLLKAVKYNEAKVDNFIESVLFDA